MGNIRFENNQILFDGNAIAMHEDCCCVEYSPDDCSACFDAGKTPKYANITFTGVDDCGQGDCIGLNSTFILEHDLLPYPYGMCVWGIDSDFFIKLGISGSTKNIFVGDYCFQGVVDSCETEGSADNTSYCIASSRGENGSASWSIP